ncbi:MAG: hydantoinase/oxoprolinase family protein [Alphaproteobacteria bacterium]
MATVFGWDIGGVHIKLAVVKDGQLISVEQIPCTLWLGVEHLHDALQVTVARYGQAAANARHAVTMTGELAENFASREDGVRTICKETCAILGEDRTRFYSACDGSHFVNSAVVSLTQHWPWIASTNWHASATWAASQRANALLIDIGSTTTDIIPLVDGEVRAPGFTDAERLARGGLVYSGVVRTSLMVMGEAPFAGVQHRLMAENFSTTADIYRLTEELHPDDDSYPASDGRGKSAPECRARIARMFGRDAAEAYVAEWDFLARYFRERQLQMFSEAIAQVLSAERLPTSAPFLAAGAGHFLVPELARRFGHPCETFADLAPTDSEEQKRRAGVCAPAAAVGLLAATCEEW